jgi:hypothetical protein
MPISSTDVSNIIAGQEQALSSSSQYARSISNMFGFQPSGGQSTRDPRNTSYAQAGMMGSAMARAPDAMAGAMGGAAMFGMGPRVMDPFSMAFRMGSIGFGTQGVAGALGMGAATLGVYGAMGSASNWATGQMASGAQTRGALNQQMGGMFPGMNSPQLGAMSSSVENIARTGMGSLKEITGLLEQGVSSGAVDGSSITRFQTSFSNLVSRVRQVATVLNSTLTEANSAIESVRGLGVSRAQAPGLIGMMKGVGTAAGISPNQMYGIAASGAQLAHSTGADVARTAEGAMTSAGIYSLAERTGIAGVTGRSQGAFTQGAMRFLTSRYGRQAMGAIMTPTGGMDEEAAQQLASGGMDRNEILRRYRKTAATAGGRDRLTARSGEMATAFISQFGPQAIAPALNEITSASSRPESLRMGLTGLSRSDIDSMSQMSIATSGLSQRLGAAAREGFRSGQQRAGLMGSMSQSFDKLIAPIREQFQKYGAELTQATSDALEDVTKQFVRQPPAKANPQAYANYFKMMMTGNTTGMSLLGAGGGGQATFGGATGSIANQLPQFLSLQAMSPGTKLSELSMGGMGTASWNPGMTGLAAASAFKGFGGRNVMGAVGGMMRHSGMRALGGIGGIGRGMLTDFGMKAGMSRLGGLGMAGAGGALGMVGGALGAVGGLMMLGDLATNSGPALMRASGLMEHTENLISGDSARALRFMHNEGDVGLASFSAEDAPTAIAQGMRPVSGTRGLYAGPSQFSKANKWIQSTRGAYDEIRALGKDRVNRVVKDANLGSTDAESKINYINTKLGLNDREKAKRIAYVKGVLGELDIGHSQADPAAALKVLKDKVNATLSSNKTNFLGGAMGLVAYGLDGNNKDNRNKSLNFSQFMLQLQSDNTGISARDKERRISEYFGNMRGRPLNISPNDAARAVMQNGDLDSYTVPAATAEGNALVSQMNIINDVLANQEATDVGNMDGFSATVGLSGGDSFAREYHKDLQVGFADPRVGARGDYMRKLLSNKVSAAGIAGLGGRMITSGSEMGMDVGSRLHRLSGMVSARERYGKRSPGKMISGILGTNIGAIDSQSRRYLRGKSDRMSVELETKLMDATRQIMRASMPSGETISDEQVSRHVHRLIEGTRGKFMGKGDAALNESMVRLAQMSPPGSPSSSGKPGEITAQMNELMGTIGGLNQKIAALRDLLP